MKKILIFSLFFVCLFGIILSYLLFPINYPEWNIAFNLDRDKAKNIARNEIKESGANLDKYSFISYYEIDFNLLKYLNQKYSIDSFEKVVSSYNVTYYKVNVLYQSDSTDITINNKEIETKNSSKISYKFIINTYGKILKYEKKYPDNYKFEYTDSSYAYDLCRNYLAKKYHDISFNIYDVKIINALNKNSLLFFAKGEDKLNNAIIAKVEVSNREIINLKINYEFELSDSYKFDTNKNDGYEIISTIVIVILLLILVVLMIQRIKNDEINFKFGIISGIILGALFAVSSVFALINQGELPGFYILIPILFIFAFFGIIFLVIISGTDSVSRYYWNEKFHSFDAIIKGHFFVSKVRDSILKGFIFAGIFLLFSTLFTYILRNILNFDKELFFAGDYNSIINILGNKFSFLYLVFPVVVVAIIYSFGCPLFITSLFKMKIKSNVLIVVFSAIIIALVDIPVGIKPNNIYAHFVYSLLFGAILTIIFIKYDLLTIILAMFFDEVIFSIIKFNYFRIDGTELNLILLAAILTLFFIVYVVSLLLKKEINYEELTPSIVKRITERERISKEIEAARHIQQSFLPYKIPDISGLDVGSICLPAYEVGGDYYDLFKIDENKLAIVIGDVSGKGIKAAFYMTLVKGIIKAQSLMYRSPAEMLTKANKIFYELVEKGNFISLIYGIFDMETKCLTYANAGHNYLIIKEISRGSIRFDKTEGLALGLSEDSIFSKNINEQTISFRPGDIFIFYTDGVVEAMNKERIEFGNENFLELINEISGNKAQDMISIIVQRVKKFIGKADQHDDLTLLIVKIK